jgi:hypothetical protein
MEAISPGTINPPARLAPFTMESPTKVGVVMTLPVMVKENAWMVPVEESLFVLVTTRFQ